eukprot:GEMP01005332.1.p1 GENE.GEMP01005332.1~~GEMP01005332.1.p1  ORF type:complete len:797 (+),score=195.24 GEMP01005332.1:453-2843(+)
MTVTVISTDVDVLTSQSTGGTNFEQCLDQASQAGVYPRHMLLFLRTEPMPAITIAHYDDADANPIISTASPPCAVTLSTPPPGFSALPPELSSSLLGFGATTPSSAGTPVGTSMGTLRALTVDVKDQPATPRRLGHNNPWRQFVKRIAASSSEEAVRMHEEMLNAGVEADVYSFSAVMTACQRNNDCNQVIRCFHEMKSRGLEPDLLAYNTVIMAYANKGLSEKVFELFHEMKDAGVNPDSRTYTFVIAACSKIEGGQEIAEQIFEELKSKGIEATKSTYKSMMTLFGVHSPSTSNSVCHSRELSPMGRRTDNYQEHVLMDDIFRGPSQMLSPNKGGRNIQNSVTSGNSVVPLMVGGRHLSVRSNGFASGSVRSCTSNYAGESANSLSVALRGTSPRGSAAVSLAGTEFEKGGDRRNPRLLLQEMRERGMQLDVKTYNAALFTCARVAQLLLAEDIFNDMKDTDVQPDMQSYNAMISACAKVSALDKAEKYFAEMKERNFVPETITYNGLISAAGRSNDCEKAEHFFQQMKDAGLEPDCASFNALLAAVAKHSLERSEELLEEMLNRKIQLTLISYTTLISAASKSSTPKRAEDFFRMMHEDNLWPNAVTYTSMISAAAQYSIKRAFDLYKEMTQMNLAPTSKIFKTLLETCIDAYGEFDQTTDWDACEEIADNVGGVIRHMHEANVEIERHTKVNLQQTFEQHWNVINLFSSEAPISSFAVNNHGNNYNRNHGSNYSRNRGSNYNRSTYNRDTIAENSPEEKEQRFSAHEAQGNGQNGQGNGQNKKRSQRRREGW